MERQEHGSVADGWAAITKECERIYPNQKEPLHYGTLLSWELGGKDPLRGISVYDGGDYWHFVTYGLTELYGKESEDREVSGYGMEFTLKLRKGCYNDENAEIMCICGILQQIARITFTSGEVFNAFEYLYTGQTAGFDAEQRSALTGFITIPDTALRPIDTPNGRVDFVEFIGVTDAELLALKDDGMDVGELYERLGSDVTDHSRTSVI